MEKAQRKRVPWTKSFLPPSMYLGLSFPIDVIGISQGSSRERCAPRLGLSGLLRGTPRDGRDAGRPKKLSGSRPGPRQTSPPPRRVLPPPRRPTNSCFVFPFRRFVLFPCVSIFYVGPLLPSAVGVDGADGDGGAPGRRGDTRTIFCFVFRADIALRGSASLRLASAISRCTSSVLV